jgi:hypothetical protein
MSFKTSTFSINSFLNIFSSSSKKEINDTALASKPAHKMSGFKKIASVKRGEESKSECSDDISKDMSEDDFEDLSVDKVFYTCNPEIDWDDISPQEFDEFGDTFDRIMIPWPIVPLSHKRSFSLA